MSKYNRSYFEDREGVYAGYRYEQVYPFMRMKAKSLIEICNPTRVLDVGCAKGFLVKAFRDLGVEAVGVDVSVYAIKNSATKDVVLNEVEMGLGLKDNTFDLVTCLETVEHLKSPKNLVLEVMRVLRPRGYFFITTPSPRSRESKKDLTHVSVLFENEWMQMFEAFERLYEEEKCVRRAVANYYSSRNPSSFIGKILSHIELRNFAIHLKSQRIQPRHHYLYLLREK